MDDQGGLTEKELQNLLPYIVQFLSSKSSKNDKENSPSKSNEDNSLAPVEKNFISSILQEKYKSLSSILANTLAQIEQTRGLERSLLSYLDYNILKVENHLIKIDFWQNHGLHKDVMPLRAQMQQQLFQLEQQKVNARVNINNQILQLSREARSLMKEVNEIKIQLGIFSNDARPL